MTFLGSQGEFVMVFITCNFSLLELSCFASINFEWQIFYLLRCDLSDSSSDLFKKLVSNQNSFHLSYVFISLIISITLVL